MATRMLIDATHAEETRVVTIRGNRLEEFDFETSTKKQLKGNIYLAKVTRVEPSLQAAFVEYGGNRHGFLAFNEIHPDYYQIPVADREMLLKQYAEEERAAAEAFDAEADDAVGSSASTQADAAPENGDAAVVEPVESVGGDEIDDVSPRRQALPRSYKIQEVIKRRQILLVQVTKEERGNKGAALTTYLSLAGRYCVLMPNTARGGGISRKIVNSADRKHLKEIATSLNVPEGMGVIIRTAGMKRSKAEIKRDYEYLLRLWDTIREKTLQSTAPALIYEEADLIKRSIRDLYSKDVEEVLVEGDDGYRAAKEFMRMLMPSHAKRVKRYKERIPLFHRFQVDQQFDSMYSPDVTLKSGGYIVINPTEALVSIDVNSGRSTRERNIEETAYKTNLEAAEELARQLRLRDLAGLIVIDFIDMDNNQNNRNVERRLKECLKTDRARIQVGRISAFGLLEMSRQRLRPSLLEASTEICPHCRGMGVIRSTESTVLHVLRAIEDEGIRERSAKITLFAPTKVALYILNQKREALHEIEQRYGFQVMVDADDSLIPPDYRIDRVTGKTSAPQESETGEQEAVQAPIEQEREEDAPPEEETKKRGRRRRRRPRGERGEASVESQTEPASESAETAAGEGVSRPDEEARPVTEDGETAPPKRSRRSRRGGRRRSKATTPETSAPSADETVETAIGEAGEASQQPVTTVAPEGSGDEAAASVDGPGEDGPGEEAPKPARTRRGGRSRTRAPRRDASAPSTPKETGAAAEAPAEAPAAMEVVPSPPAVESNSLPVSVPVALPAPERPVESIAHAVPAEATETASPSLESSPEAEKPKETKPKAPATRRLGWWRRKA